LIDVVEVAFGGSLSARCLAGCITLLSSFQRAAGVFEPEQFKISASTMIAMIRNKQNAVFHAFLFYFYKSGLN
jgi:hypothetical protein